MLRQGDVLLKRVTGGVPKGAERIAPEAGRLVLAHGEATGHAHVVDAERAALFLVKERVLLRVAKPTDLRHEEHGPIPLPAGLYEVVRQREYDVSQEAGARLVRD